MTLQTYIEQLVNLTRESEPDAYERLQQVVRNRIAQIGLDDENVTLQFVEGELQIHPSVEGERIDGKGFTDSATVTDLLDARIEISKALRLGRIEVLGTPEDIDRIFVAIEILIDVSTRTPAMQELSYQFHPELRKQSSFGIHDDTYIYPFRCPESEYDMLVRLDLIPGK